MTAKDPVAEFFDGLSERGHEPVLGNATGTVRFDVVGGKQTESWTLTVKKGDLAVSRNGGKADVVIRGDRKLLEKLVRGEANAVAALLRGELTTQGDAELLVLMQRLLPRPHTRAPKRARGSARRKA